VQQKHGQSWQYLVKWVGYGDEANSRLPRRELDDCAPLDPCEMNQSSRAAQSTGHERLANGVKTTSALSISRPSNGPGLAGVGEAGR
jgi:hypothetical protein